MRIVWMFIISFFYFTAQSQTLSVPKINSVSIDPNTNAHAIVEWDLPNLAEGVSYYGVKYFPYPSPTLSYRIVNPVRVNMPITTYRGAITDFSKRVSYRIQAFQSLSSNSSSALYEAMELQAGYNVCANQIILTWTTYQMYAIDNSTSFQKPNDPEADAYNAAITYEVWGYSAPIGSTFNLNQATLIKFAGKQNIDFVLDNVQNNRLYFLFIKAILPGGKSATSNRVDVISRSPKLPDVMQIDTLISKDGTQWLHFNFDRTTGLDTFALYRSDNPFRPIQWFYNKEVPMSYLDNRGLALGQIYGYHLAAFRCGKVVLRSDTVSNIILSTDPKDLAVGLSWTPGMSSLPLDYRLIRINPPPSVHVDVQAGVTTYKDESVADSLCNGPKDFSYYLEAYNNNILIRSDVANAFLQPVVSMPNAIDPQSNIEANFVCRCSSNMIFARNKFGPIFDLNATAYKLTLEIYTRSGKRIFQSIKQFNDTKLHYWDGYDGKKAQEGSYFYGMLMEFKSGAPSITKRGTLTLLYNE